MVFVEKYKSWGRTYYRLVHSYRKGNKILQFKKQLGKELLPKKRLEQIKKDFLRKIKGDKYTYLSGKDIEKIENKKNEYNKEIKKLSKLEKEQRLKEFIIRFTYDSSKLSGVDVTLRQIYLILKEGIIPQNIRNLRKVRELENHEKGILAISKYKGKLNNQFMKRLHRILFLGVENEIAGKFRYELKRNVKIAGASYVPPKWQDLKKIMTNFFKWYESERKEMHPLELAAMVHLKIISMQPFGDGNSRLSRLLMNWILWKRNYPSVDIPIEDIENYYDVLDQYQIEGNEKPFIEYVKKWYLKNN